MDIHNHIKIVVKNTSKKQGNYSIFGYNYNPFGEGLSENIIISNKVDYYKLSRYTACVPIQANVSYSTNDKRNKKKKVSLFCKSAAGPHGDKEIKITPKKNRPIFREALIDANTEIKGKIASNSEIHFSLEIIPNEIKLSNFKITPNE